MHSLTHASKPMLRQWLQSTVLHGILLVCALLYHLHGHGSLYVSINSLNQAGSIAIATASENSVDFLELSFEQYATTEAQLEDEKPTDLVVEAAIDVAKETLNKVPLNVLIERPKQQLVAAIKELKATSLSRTSARPISRPAAGAHHIAAQPIQTARPDYAYSPKPAYPLALRDLGLSGVVWLRVWVDETGRPQEIELSKGSGYRLFDEAALRAVQHWRFIPAKNEQQSLASWVEFAVRFEING